MLEVGGSTMKCNVPEEEVREVEVCADVDEGTASELELAIAEEDATPVDVEALTGALEEDDASGLAVEAELDMLVIATAVLDESKMEEELDESTKTPEEPMETTIRDVPELDAITVVVGLEGAVEL